MARVKVIKTQLDGNLNGNYFNDTPSNTIFSFGKFFVTTNFDNKTNVDYTNSLSSFVRPVTLETMGISEIQSTIIQNYSNNAVLNLDKSDLNSYVRYGSAYEFMRVSIQEIIVKYPGSLFINSQTNVGGNITYTTFNYNSATNVSTFLVPIDYAVNTFGLVINKDNLSIPDDNELKNLNLSYSKYVIWSDITPDKSFKIIGYTGNTVNSSAFYDGTTLVKSKYLKIKVEGNPFNSTLPEGDINYHIRPNNNEFEEFRALLNNYEQNIISQRDGVNGFIFTLKDPTLLENGKIVYSDSQILWNTSDGYNIDTNTPIYQRFLKVVLTIAAKYDKIKTDLIARFLTTDSLKIYDYSEEGKITKLLRIYGREFDQIRQFIDSLVNINKVTYNKQNNVPDQIIKNMADTFGWDYFNLVNETEMMNSFLSVDDTERNLNDNTLPAEIDIELWRRIINNTSYFWKSKGTRQALKSMFLLIGIPEEFINITEYVYTADGKIDPNTVTVAQEDFPSNSLPYDSDGYPIAPLETSDFYFQISGDSDNGQAYLDVFRQAGFNITPIPDNKKSWVEAGAVTRVHPSTPSYYQEDSRLVINTKQVDIALDTARGIEFDVFDYLKEDCKINSTGYTLSYSYVNISSLTQVANTFTLPYNVNEIQGDFEVRYNGILLNAPSTGNTTGITSGITYQADYSVSGNTFTIPVLSGGTRSTDVIQATFITSGASSPISGITVEYIVTRVKANLNGTYVPLPSYPFGDVQLTINGIALTKGTSQFIADYILDPSNSTGGTNNIIIQNPDVIAFLNENPDVQISYMNVIGSNDINLRSEIYRIDSFNSGKVYYNSNANKYVYKLNYKLNQASDVKLLIDGIALEPYTDYTVNVQNPFEIFLPRGLRYGSVISAYYLVGGTGAFAPIVSGDLLCTTGETSFLEFYEKSQRRLINARTRKTITDFKGGWYPTILKMYQTYLRRSTLPNDDPQHSNGYTFVNLYPFLSKYNAFFQKFVDQLLSSTIILRKGGLLVRNTDFTKQKHWYKRGVNLYSSGSTKIDIRGNQMLQYLGDDGSSFNIVQDTTIISPTQLYVETIQGVIDGNSIISGGENVLNYSNIDEYGIDYRQLGGVWSKITETTPLTGNSYSITIPNVIAGTTYEYRSIVFSDGYGYTGNTLQTTIPVVSASVKTTIGIPEGYDDGGVYKGRIATTGGYDVVKYDEVIYHGMQYRVSGDSTWIIAPNPPATTLSSNSWSYTIDSLSANTSYEYRAYINVNGSYYYGETRTISLPAEPESVFTVITDPLPNSIGTTAFLTCENSYTSGSGVPNTICEYGTVYSQSASIGSDVNLCLPNSSALSVRCAGSTSSPFNTCITGLTPNTMTYYRAFVKNGDSDVTNVGYGCVHCFMTAPAPPTTFDLDLEINYLGTVCNLSGVYGDFRLFEQGNSTPVDTLSISNTSPKLAYGHTFNNLDVCKSYCLDFQCVKTMYNNHPILKNHCWSWLLNPYNCYTSEVTTSITNGDATTHSVLYVENNCC